MTLGEATPSFRTSARQRAVLLRVSYGRCGGKVSRSITIPRSKERRYHNCPRRGFLYLNTEAKEKSQVDVALQLLSAERAGFLVSSSIIDQLAIIESLESECSIHRTLRTTPRTPRGTTSKPISIFSNVVLTIISPPVSRELYLILLDTPLVDPRPPPQLRHTHQKVARDSHYSNRPPLPRRA